MSGTRMRAVVCQACLGVHSSSEGGRGASGMEGDGGIEDEEKDREGKGEREAKDFRRSGGCVGEDDDDEAGGLKLQLYLTAAVSIVWWFAVQSNAAAPSSLRQHPRKLVGFLWKKIIFLLFSLFP